MENTENILNTGQKTQTDVRLLRDKGKSADNLDKDKKKGFGSSLDPIQQILFNIGKNESSGSTEGNIASEDITSHQDADGKHLSQVTHHQNESVSDLAQKTREVLISGIHTRVKGLLQDLEAYQSDQTSGPSNYLVGKMRATFLGPGRENHKSYNRGQVMENISKEGERLTKLIAKYEKSHSGTDHSITEADLQEIVTLLQGTHDTYERAKTKHNSDGDKIPQDTREKAVRNLQETYDLLQKKRSDLEWRCYLEKIDGNADLLNADFVGFGENHFDPVHHEHCAKMIEFLVAQKGGAVIVYVEGEQSGTEVSSKRIPSIHRLSEETKKHVILTGWDDRALSNTAINLRKNMNDKLNLYNLSENLQDKEKYASEVKQIHEQWQNIATKQRNQVLVKTLFQMAQRYPKDHKVISVVIAGNDHFTEDRTIQNYLESQNYAYTVLRSSYESSDEDIQITQNQITQVRNVSKDIQNLT